MPNLDSETIQTIILDPVEVAAICVFFFTQWSKNSFFAPQGTLVCTIFMVDFKFLIWLLFDNQVIRIFPQIFNTPSGETTDQIKKKLREVQKWDGPPLSPCQVSWGLWDARGCRQESVMFFVCHALE